MTPALANHLWQSTVFAVIVSLLALALRNNHARMRYRLWLIASLKFQIPFSLLFAAGEHLRWPAAAPVARPAVSAVVEQLAQPFPYLPTSPSVPARAAASIVPLILFAVWICGCVAVGVAW